VYVGFLLLLLLLLLFFIIREENIEYILKREKEREERKGGYKSYKSCPKYDKVCYMRRCIEDFVKSGAGFVTFVTAQH